MADDILTQQFNRFNLPTRVRNLIDRYYGSFDAVGDAIRHKDVHYREDGSTYVLTGWFWGTAKSQIGYKTALEIVAAALVLGKVSWEDCDFDGISDPGLQNRRWFNERAKTFGWQGPFLPDRKRPDPKDKAAVRLAKLTTWRARLERQIAAIDAEISELDV